ncbi:hypothetical protein QUF72_09155 [Desulfobacterales bacterium HSG2]|nr:hypothetical protein [Desulfobacterales bacterium HSG2]
MQYVADSGNPIRTYEIRQYFTLCRPEHEAGSQCHLLFWNALLILLLIEWTRAGARARKRESYIFNAYMLS